MLLNNRAGAATWKQHGAFELSLTLLHSIYLIPSLKAEVTCRLIWMKHLLGVSRLLVIGRKTDKCLDGTTG